MNITELEKSTNILDRQQYVKHVKEYISEIESRIEQLSKNGLRFQYLSDNYKELHPAIEVAETANADINAQLLRSEKELLKKLKIRLSEYDIYNQKAPYVCLTCHESDCICQELQPEKGILDDEISTPPQTEIGV